MPGLYFIFFGQREAREWLFQSPESPETAVSPHNIIEFGWHEEEALAGKATGGDPFLVFREDLLLDAAVLRQLVLDIKIEIYDQRPAGFTQLFWMRKGETGFREEASTSFAIRNDGRFHRYRFDLSENPAWRGVITKIRMDPLNHEGRFAIRRIRFGPIDLNFIIHRHFSRAPLHEKSAVLLTALFVLFVIAKKFMSLFFPTHGLTARLDRTAASFPMACLLIFFCLFSFFPFNQYPGARFRLLGADCLFPLFFLYFGLLTLFLEKGGWRTLRILIAGLLIFYIFMLEASPGHAPLDGWRMAGFGLIIGLMVMSIWRTSGKKMTLFQAGFFLFVAAAFVSYFTQGGEPAGRYFLFNFFLPALVISTLARESFLIRHQRSRVIKFILAAGALVAFTASSSIFSGGSYFPMIFTGNTPGSTRDTAVSGASDRRWSSRWCSHPIFFF